MSKLLLKHNHLVGTSLERSGASIVACRYVKQAIDCVEGNEPLLLIGARREWTPSTPRKIQTRRKCTRGRLDTWKNGLISLGSQTRGRQKIAAGSGHMYDILEF
jgi:hypothetical protein